jgi:hypothetical protein
MANKAPTHADIRRMFGTVDDHKALEILDLDPSAEELEITMAYLADMTDVMGEERQPLSGKAAEIYEIVIRDEFFPEDEEPGPR